MKIRITAGAAALVAAVGAPALSVVPQTGYAQEVEEIVVSVRRRDENLQEVPLSVSTIGKEQLDRFGINNTQDVIKYTAGLNFDEGLGAQDTRIVIRGLSPTRGRSNVAFLVDGVDFTGEAVQTAGGGVLVNQRLLDVERVEVVKGPQSALYGRSAFAGAIQYITKRPSLEEWEGNADVQYGNGGGADQYSFSGAYGGPVTDFLGLRLNGTYFNEEGFYQNELNGQDLGGSEGYGIALTGIFDQGGIFSANWRAAYSHDEFDPQAQTRVLANRTVDVNDSLAVQNGETDNLISTSGLGSLIQPSYPDCEPGLGGTGADGTVQSCLGSPRTLVTGTMPDGDSLDVIQSDNPRRGSGGYDGTDVDLITGTLNLSWDFEPGVFSSLSGGSYLDSEQFFDGQIDALPAGSYESLDGSYAFTLAECGFADCSPTKQELDFDNTTKLFSQELRWQSKLDGPINYTVGGLYWKERVRQDANSTTISPAIFRQAPSFTGAPPAPGTPPPIEGLPAANSVIAGVVQPNGSTTRRDTRSWSVYGVVEWDMTDTWKLTVEGRYVDEKLDVSSDTCDVAATEAFTGLDSREVELSTGETVLACAQEFRGQSSTGIADGTGVLAAGTYTKAVYGSESATFDNDFIAPKATIEWAVTDTQLFYGSIAKGVKPGGISTITAGAFFDPVQNEFDDEKLWAYELGSKSTLLDGSLLLNAAIYYQDYDDKQVGVTRFDEIIQTDVGAIENAGAAETYGLELEATWLVSDNWTIAAAYAYTKAEYTDFEIESSSGTNVARSLAGGGDGCKTLVRSEGAGNPPDGFGESCIIDLSDNDVEDVPEHSLVGNVRYDAPLNNELDWYSSASFIYNDERYIDEWNIKKLDSYWTMDFRAGLIADQWELIAFVDNVFDDDTVKSAVDFGAIVDSTRQGFFPPSPPDGVVVSLPDPRVAGVRASYRF